MLIVLMSASTFTTQRQLMQKNMPAAALDNPFAKQQKMLMYILPLFFAISGVNFPIGVLLYWLTTNVWSMGQQFYVIRRMPAPGSQAEKDLQARRARKAKSHPTGGGDGTPARRAPRTAGGPTAAPGRAAAAAQAQPAPQEAPPQAAGQPRSGRVPAPAVAPGPNGRPADPDESDPGRDRLGQGRLTPGRAAHRGRPRAPTPIPQHRLPQPSAVCKEHAVSTDEQHTDRHPRAAGRPGPRRREPADAETTAESTRADRKPLTPEERFGATTARATTRRRRRRV